MIWLPLRLPGYCELSDALKRELVPMPATCNKAGCYSPCYSKTRSFTQRATYSLRALRAAWTATKYAGSYAPLVRTLVRVPLKFELEVRTSTSHPLIRTLLTVASAVTTKSYQNGRLPSVRFPLRFPLAAKISSHQDPEFNEPSQSPATPSMPNARLC